VRRFLLACVACGRLGFSEREAPDAEPIDAGIDAAIAPPVLVQAKGFENNNQTTLTGQLNVTAGDTLIATVDLDPIENLVGITDSLGSTYAIAGPFDGQNLRIYITHAKIAATGPVTVTATADNPPGIFGLRLHELSGIADDPLDVAATATGTANPPTTVSGPTLTTTAGGELVFALSLTFNPATASPGPGYTTVLAFDGDISESRFAPSPGPQTVQTDLDTGTNIGWLTAAAAFRAK
jgi:hypothetical protein